MSISISRSCVLMIAIVSLLVSYEATAMTAGDVLDRMETVESAGYIAGAVNMMAQMVHLGGDPARAQCIYDWYYQSDDAKAAVVQVFELYPDRVPEHLLITLVNRACPSDG